MNLKNTVILLIFLLSILGLIIGIYYSEDIKTDNSHTSQWKRTYEEYDSVLTVTLEKKENNDLSKYFT
ncbi:hypothetical protein [Methanobrevibacter sp.]